MQIKTLLFLSLTTLLILSFLEFTCFLFYTPTYLDILSTKVQLKPQLQREYKYCQNKKLCYDVKYIYDSHGNRFLEKTHKKKHLVILGDSIPFGTGIPTEKTFPYLLNLKTKWQTYNFSWPGTGPSYALNKVESSDIKKQIKERTGVALYLLFDFHVARMSYDTRRFWTWNLPAYSYENNNLKKYEAQIEQSFHLKYLYSTLAWLRQNSYTFKYFNLYYSPNSPEKNLKTMEKVFKEIQYQYEKKFNGKFIVLGAPIAGPSQKLINRFKEL